MNFLSTLLNRIRPSRFIKGEKIATNSVTLNHQRIFILPTKNGLGFVVLISILLLIAFVYQNNLIYILAFFLASVFFVCIIHSFKSLAGLAVQTGKSKAVFAGETAPFTIHLKGNARYNFPALAIKTTGQDVIETQISTQEYIAITLYSLTRKRGWHRCQTITISSIYPLGFFRAWAPINFDLKVLVYPKPFPSNTPFPESNINSEDAGIWKKNHEDFFGLNTYQPGDSIRQIHWKTFAKGQGLHSKEFISQENPEIWLDYQQTPGRDKEERLSLLCRWIIEAEKNGLNYGLKLVSTIKKPANGTPHFHECLEALAIF